MASFFVSIAMMLAELCLVRRCRVMTTMRICTLVVETLRHIGALVRFRIMFVLKWGWVIDTLEATDSFTISASPNLGILRQAHNSSFTSQHDLDSKSPLLNGNNKANQDKLTSVHSWSTVDKASFHSYASGEHVAFGFTLTQTVFNGFNIFVGIGLLSMPSTVREGGLASVLLLIVYAAVCFYTGTLLRQCLNVNKHVLTFLDLGEVAFGKYSRLFLCIVFYIELYFCCVEFVILEADNLAKLFPSAALYLGGLYLSPSHLLGIIATLVVLPTCYLKDFRVLSVLSAVGVLGAILIVLSLILVGTVEKIGFSQTGPVVAWSGLPCALGLVMALAGSLLCLLASTIMPSLCFLRVIKEPSFSQMVICYTVAAIGVAVAMFGTYSSMYEIVESY
ncbi:hypothetical protein Droror1_Dr00009871 [Drosera rotundifolia]